MITEHCCYRKISSQLGNGQNYQAFEKVDHRIMWLQKGKFTIRHFGSMLEELELPDL